MSSRPSPSRVAWYRLMKVCATQPGRDKGEQEAEEDLQPSSLLLNHDYLVAHTQLLLRPGQRPGTLRYVEKYIGVPLAQACVVVTIIAVLTTPALLAAAFRPDLCIKHSEATRKHREHI